MCVHEKFTYTIRLCHKSQVPKFLIRPQGTIQLYENTFFFLSSVNTTQSRMTFILEFVEQLPYTQNCTHHTSNVHARLQWQQQQLAPNCTQNQNLKIFRPNVFVTQHSKRSAYVQHQLLRFIVSLLCLQRTVQHHHTQAIYVICASVRCERLL